MRSGWAQSSPASRFACDTRVGTASRRPVRTGPHLSCCHQLEESRPRVRVPAGRARQAADSRRVTCFRRRSPLGTLYRGSAGWPKPVLGIGSRVVRRGVGTLLPAASVLAFFFFTNSFFFKKKIFLKNEKLRSFPKYLLHTQEKCASDVDSARKITCVQIIIKSSTLKKMPKLSNWGLTAYSNPYRAPELHIPLVAFGEISDHPILPDGPIQTSLVQYIDMETKTLQTTNTLYELEAMQSGYEDFLRNDGSRLAQVLLGHVNEHVIYPNGSTNYSDPLRS